MNALIRDRDTVVGTHRERAEATWTRNRSSDRLSLAGRIDFRHGLTNQLPASPCRIVYGKSGMHLTAAMVNDSQAIIDHKLYWAAAESPEEAVYLCALINSPILTERVRPLMSYGKDERDVDKHLWRLPIPLFDSSDSVHRRIVTLGEIVTDEIAKTAFDFDANFVTVRRWIRRFLATLPAARELDAIVSEML
jgi:hypothetical protein